MPRQIALYLLPIALVALSGCRSGIDSDANFFVAASGDRAQTTFVPQGYGWVLGSRIEISVYGEPRRSGNEIVSSGEWRSLGFVTPDSYGMFGFNSGALTSVVQRTICGPPPPWLAQPLFLARDTGTGKVRFFSGKNDYWFTFDPCH